MSFPVEPNIGPNGVPYCAQEACGSYDGKRCRAMGFRPDSICEPAVADMAKLLLKCNCAAMGRGPASPAPSTGKGEPRG